MFQHTAARGRLQLHFLSPNLDNKFQHTAARRRLPNVICSKACGCQWFQHTAARRRLPRKRRGWSVLSGFNTQPPEGGCLTHLRVRSQSDGFNTQPPEGGCIFFLLKQKALAWFQHTAARRRLHLISFFLFPYKKFQHTAARRRLRICFVN